MQIWLQSLACQSIMIVRLPEHAGDLSILEKKRAKGVQVSQDIQH